MLTVMTTPYDVACMLATEAGGTVDVRATQVQRALWELGMLPLAIHVVGAGESRRLYGVSAMFAAVRRLWVMGLIPMAVMDKYGEMLGTIPTQAVR